MTDRNTMIAFALVIAAIVALCLGSQPLTGHAADPVVVVALATLAGTFRPRTAATPNT